MHDSGLTLPLVFLLAAVIAVPLFKRFGFGAVLAYLCAGVLLGPSGLRVINDPDRVLAASEIGVVMMLFLIGLELSLSRLKVMRRPIFFSGGMQVVLSSIALTGLALFFGLTRNSSMVVGIALALSSTAVGLQILSERKEINHEYGRVAFAILLLQDLVAIPLLAAIPLLGYSTSEEGLSWVALGRALGAFLALFILGRIVLRYLFRIVARTGIPEVFTGASLLVVLGSAWIMAGAGLSAGLGAFIAGVLLAESEYRHELESQIEPFKGLLLGLFFIAVGMSINVDIILHDPLLIVLGVLILLAVKFAILFGVGRATGRLNAFESLQLAAVLAAGGEFAFVVFNQAVKFKLIERSLNDQLNAIVTLSMALTPFLVLGIARLRPFLEKKAEEEKLPFDTIPAGNAEVLIAGFGRFGQIIGRFLAAQKIPFVAIDNSPDQVAFMRRFGNQLFYGDAARPDLLRAAGGEHIKVFVIALEKSDENKRTVRMIRRLYPQATVFARARDRQHAWELMDMGAKPVRELFYSSMSMNKQILKTLGVPAETAADRVLKFSQWDDALMQEQYLVYDNEEMLRATASNARAQLESLFEADTDSQILDSREPAEDR